MILVCHRLLDQVPLYPGLIIALILNCYGDGKFRAMRVIDIVAVYITNANGRPPETYRRQANPTQALNFRFFVVLQSNKSRDFKLGDQSTA